MERLENTTVTAADQLATLYSPPSERVLRKEIDHVDAVGRAFIAASPFLILATGGSQGLDCSPKGDKPGFVQVEDDGHTLLIPDRRGNNRIDSIKNVVEDPRVADLPGPRGERNISGQRSGPGQCRSDPEAAFCCRRQRTHDGDRGCGRTGLPALPQGACPL